MCRDVLFLFVAFVINSGCNQTSPDRPDHADGQAVDRASGSAAEPSGAQHSTDFLAEVRAANSPTINLPGKFRTGHVEAKTFELEPASRSEDGFTVSLASESPVPTPLVHRGRIYVGGGFSCHEFYCFDGSTGELVWSVQLDDDGPSSAAAEDDTIFINTESCTIYALDANTGAMRWSYWLGDPLMSIPTAANGRVFAVYPVEGTEQPDADEDADQQKAAPSNGIADAGKQTDSADAESSGQQTTDGKRETDKSFTHALICFDLQTGEILWQRLIDSDCISAPVAVDDTVYVTTFTGHLYEFSQADGEILAASKIRATSAPVVADNRIFVTRRTDSGADDAEVREAMVMLDRRGTNELYVANDRVAPYLDRHIQEHANSTKASNAFEAKNGIMGGFGGGFFAVGMNEEAAGPPSNEPAGLDKSDQAAAGDEDKDDQPVLDKLAEAQLKAADNIGQGNVSMLQSFQGSRILNWGRWNFSCMGNSLIGSLALTGQAIWTLPLEGNLAEEGGHLAAPPVAAGDRLFVATLKGDVLQIVPETGVVEKSYSVGAPIRFAPSIDMGRIYVGTQTGKLVCINTGDRRFTGWPMWGRNPGRNSIYTSGRRP